MKHEAMAVTHSLLLQVDQVGRLEWGQREGAHSPLCTETLIKEGQTLHFPLFYHPEGIPPFHLGLFDKEELDFFFKLT